MENEETLYVRNISDEGDNDHDSIWDDTALQKAYDDAMKPIKDGIKQRLGLNGIESSGKEGKTKRNTSKWKVGDACRATYSEDGKLYEAFIKSIKKNSNQCVVRYIGYENEEQVPVAQLLASAGPEAQALQQQQAVCDRQEESNDMESDREYEEMKNAQPSPSNGRRRQRFQGHYSIPTNFQPPPFGMIPPPFLPPPLPLHLTSMPSSDKEALSAMLMSWYMSGFHTGYYQGLQQSKASQTNRKS